MNYRKQYEALIRTRLSRKRKRNQYYEKHHIVPKCWGGSNNKKNLIHLTGREHYIAHRLLYKMRPHSNGASLAYWKMTFTPSPFTQREYRITSRAYEEAKSAMAEANRRLNLGRVVEEKHLKKWRKNKNNSKKIVHSETGEVYSNAKQLWRERYQDTISYSAFNYYLRGKIKGKNGQQGGPRKLYDDDVYLWSYVEA